MLKRLNSRIRFLTVTICFCAVGLVPIIGHAATYYVDQQKGDDAGPGTQAAPWATIQHAANTMVAGDTVIISPGVYTESVDLSTSGTSEAYITYQALDGAVMESPGSYPTSSFEALDIKANTAYLRFEGFELHGGFDETIFVRPGAHHIEIRHCEIYGNHTGVRWAGSFDGLLEGCQIHDNTGNGVYLSDGAHDITIRNTDSYNNNDGAGCSGDADGFAATNDTFNLTFEGSRAYDNSEDGFDLKADNVVVDRAQSFGNCRGIRFRQNGMLQNSLVYGNSKVGITVTSYGGGLVRLVNNTVDNAVKAVSSKAASYSESYTLELYNNILSSDGKPLDYFDCVALSEDYNIYFRPNPSADHIVERLGCVASSDANRYSGDDIENGVWQAESGQGSNSRAVNPLYENPTVADYMLQDASPAIDTGSSAEAPPIDLVGTSRPQGCEVDRGAYELGADNTPPVANAGADQSGDVGTMFTFDGSASFDPDCSITNYEWDFGDGSTATGAVVLHSYAAVGMYTATLTITYNGGLLDSDTATVTVEPAPAPTMHVQRVSVTLQQKGPHWTGRAQVQVVDDTGAPVSKATVTGDWDVKDVSGSTISNSGASGSTNDQGETKIDSAKIKATAGYVFTFTVIYVSKAGYTWEELPQSGSATVP